MKECPRCNDIKSLEDFRDDKLISGYGRFCNDCKGIGHKAKTQTKAKAVADAEAKLKTMGVENVKCPKCSATMVLRVRRRDGNKFYGCSRFPRCKGTKPFS